MSVAERVAQRRADTQLAQQQTHRGRVDRNTQEGRSYDEEFGLWLTEEGSGQLREYDETFDTNLKNARRELKKVSGQINQEIMTVDQAWEKAKGSSEMVEVRVYDGNDDHQASYWLPREAVDDLNQNTFNSGDGTYTGKYNNESTYSVVGILAGTDEGYGKELMAGLDEAATATQTAFYDEAAPQLASLRSQQQGYQSQVNDAQSALDMQDRAHDEEISDLQDQQQGMTDRQAEAIDSVASRKVAQ